MFQVAMITFILKIVVIGFLHCLGGVLLYRGMVVKGIPILQSELLVFYLLFLIALIAYGTVFWSSGFLQTRPVLRLAIMLGVSLLATCLSTWLYLLFALNRYGE